MPRMQIAAVLLLVIALAFSTLADGQSSSNGNSAGQPKCLGVVLMHDYRVALISGMPPRNRIVVLGEGYREGDTELVKLEPEKGRAQLRLQGTNVLSVPIGNGTPVPNHSLIFENAELEPILAIYQKLRETTLLRHPAITGKTFTFTTALSDPGNEEEGPAITYEDVKAERESAVRALEKAFAEKDLLLVPEGKKFTLLVPKTKAAEARPGATAALTANRWGLSQERIPVGLIDFRGVDVRQAAQFYAELVNRKLVQADIPAGSIHFHNQEVITSSEVAYAFDTLFRWQGLQLVPLGTDQATLARIEPAARSW